jgi:hypothetical protein
VDGILDWYLLGLVIGLGVVSGLVSVGTRKGVGAARLVWGLLALACLVGAIVVAIVALPWWAVLAAAAAAVLGWLAFRRLSAGAIPAAALGAVALAAIPVTGYALAVLAPAAGRRLGHRADTRYAGLRILAKD